MAKKTAAGGKKRTTVSKSVKSPSSSSSSTSGAWNDSDRYNSKFSDHKKTDGKFKAQRIEKKRG